MNKIQANKWRMDCRKEEAKAGTFVMYKNSSEEKVVSWRSRQVTVEEVTRRRVKGRDHRMCRAWVQA